MSTDMGFFLLKDPCPLVKVLTKRLVLPYCSPLRPTLHKVGKEAEVRVLSNDTTVCIIEHLVCAVSLLYIDDLC